MLRETFLLGERLAGRRDVRLLHGLAFALVEALTISAPYALVLFFVREALEGRLSASLTLWTTLGLVLAVLVRVFVATGAMANIFVAAHALMGHTRIRAADHLRHLPMGYFTAHRSGELQSVLTDDLALVEDVWSHTIGIFSASFALPMLAGMGLSVLDPRLGLVIFATLPVAMLVLAVTAPLFVRELDAVLEASSDVSARVVEYVQGIAVLRAFGRHGEVFRRLVGAMEALRDALIRADVLPSPLLAAFGFVVEASFVAIAYVGSELLLRGEIARSVLLVFLVVTVGVVRQVADLGVALLLLRASQRALARVDALFAAPRLAEPTSAKPIERFDVEVDAVSFAYEDTRVLDRVSLSFPERSLTAVVGPSGSGKSTLVHLVARLWDVPRGEGAIRIGGVDIRDVPFESLHRYMATVFQDVVLFSGSVIENIRIGKPDATLEEVENAARAARAHEFIVALPRGYGTILGEGGETLSGGERQRISIARALLKDAPIVLLDEATASVDASAELEIQHAIDELVRRKTVIVIAHRLRTVRRAHNIVVLEKGRVAELGTHETLLERGGVYAGLWARQSAGKGIGRGPI